MNTKLINQNTPRQRSPGWQSAIAALAFIAQAVVTDAAILP